AAHSRKLCSPLLPGISVLGSAFDYSALHATGGEHVSRGEQLARTIEAVEKRPEVADLEDSRQGDEALQQRRLPQVAKVDRIETGVAVVSAERFAVLDLSRPPGNPQDGRPSIGSLALRCHFLVPPFLPNTGGPRSPPGKDHLVCRAPSVRGLSSR